MSAKYLKIKTFDLKFFSLQFTVKIDRKYSFENSKKKELTFWYNPYKFVRETAIGVPKTWQDNLVKCYDLGISYNDFSSWISISLK